MKALSYLHFEIMISARTCHIVVHLHSGKITKHKIAFKKGNFVVTVKYENYEQFTILIFNLFNSITIHIHRAHFVHCAIKACWRTKTNQHKCKIKPWVKQWWQTLKAKKKKKTIQNFKRDGEKSNFLVVALAWTKKKNLNFRI